MSCSSLALLEKCQNLAYMHHALCDTGTAKKSGGIRRASISFGAMFGTGGAIDCSCPSTTSIVDPGQFEGTAATYQQARECQNRRGRVFAGNNTSMHTVIPGRPWHGPQLGTVDGSRNITVWTPLISGWEGG